jgi:hypothetical protein
MAEISILKQGEAWEAQKQVQSSLQQKEKESKLIKESEFTQLLSDVKIHAEFSLWVEEHVNRMNIS